MVIVKKIGVLSFARIYSMLLALVGLLEGVLLSVTYSVSPQDLAVENPLIYQIGYWSILALPILYALFGFFLGIIVCWLYNIFASWLGGVEVELEGDSLIKKAKK